MVHRINENPDPSTAYSSMLETTSSITRKGKGSLLLENRKLVLIVCLVSGDSTETKYFLKTQQELSWHHGVLGPKQYKTYIQRWFSFCDKQHVHSISPSVQQVIQF